MSTERKLGTGERKNEGKLRHDLVNPHALEGMVRVLTAGAKKYSDHNWEFGMPWSKVLASLKRHLTAIEKGEDYDVDPNCPDCQKGSCVNHTGELHVDLLQCNAHFLATYYRTYPQGDDRFERQRPRAKIGLDIDDVICVWASAWAEKFGFEIPTSWYFDPEIGKRMEEMKGAELDEFYLNLKPNILPEDIPFEPHAYVTSRPVDSAVTQQWLLKHGFPMRPVITVGLGGSKIDAIKTAGIDIFVDDCYKNYEELNRNGICCYLWDAPHNQRYDVGYRRINSLKDIKA